MKCGVDTTLYRINTGTTIQVDAIENHDISDFLARRTRSIGLNAFENIFDTADFIRISIVQMEPGFLKLIKDEVLGNYWYNFETIVVCIRLLETKIQIINPLTPCLLLDTIFLWMNFPNRKSIIQTLVRFITFSKIWIYSRFQALRKYIRKGPAPEGTRKKGNKKGLR